MVLNTGPILAATARQAWSTAPVTCCHVAAGDSTIRAGHGVGRQQDMVPLLRRYIRIELRTRHGIRFAVRRAFDQRWDGRAGAGRRPKSECR